MECAKHQFIIYYISFEVTVVASGSEKTSRKVITILLKHSYRRNNFSFIVSKFNLIFAAEVCCFLRRIFCEPIVITKSCRERLVRLWRIIFYKGAREFIAINSRTQFRIENIEHHLHRIAKDGHFIQQDFFWSVFYVNQNAVIFLCYIES